MGSGSEAAPAVGDAPGAATDLAFVPAREILVGRQRELADLRKATDAAATGCGGLLLVTGEPGIGKTRLGWEVFEHARQLGARPVYSASWEGDGAPAYWIWQEVLRQLADTASGGLPAPDLAAGSGATPGTDAAAARFQRFGKVADYLAAAAEPTPLVLILDDLQWADLSSLLLLQFLAARLRSLPLLIVGTYRDGEVGGSERAGIFAALDRVALRITLCGLSAAELERFVTSASGAEPSPGLATQLYRRTGGNPFFARELMRLLIAQGLDTADATATTVPATVSEVIERRLARLAQPVTDLLTTAAVIGESVPLQVLAAATGQPLATLVGLLDAAGRAGLLNQRLDDAGTVAFAHALVRETLYANLGAAGRAGMHARVGLALETLPGTDPAELAHHLLRAGPAAPRDRAVRYAVQAGQRALDALAHEHAEAWYQRALDAVGDDTEARVEALLGRAEARRRAGDLPAARDDLHDVLATARRTGMPAALARAALGVHLLGVESGAARDEPITLLDEARGVLPDSEADLKARVLASLARERRHAADDVDGDAVPLSAAALALARQAGTPDTLARCLLARHDAVWAPGTAGDRHALAEEMEAAAQRSGDEELRAEAVLLQATALLELCDPAVHARFDRFFHLADRLPQPRMTYLALTRRATHAILRGDFAGAEPLIAEAAAVAARGNEPDADNVAANVEWPLAGFTGRRADRQDRYDRRAMPWPGYHAHRALTLRAAGRHEEARRAFDIAAATRWHHEPHRIWHQIHLPMLAEAAVAFDAAEVAAECYRALLPHAGTTCVVAAAVTFSGAADHHLGVLALALDQPEAAVGHLEAAVAVHDRLTARPWAALSRCWLARAALARDGEAGRSRATDLARRAGAVAEELGMVELAGWVAELLAGEQRAGTALRNGSGWTLAWCGREVSVPDVKGLADLATLLARPGEEVLATDLIAARTSAPPPATGAADPVLDRRALAAYRSRLATLADEIDEAEQAHDSGRAERARDEREALLDELRRATGRGGRPRRLGDDAERARKAVTARIRDAIERIAGQHPALGAHLRTAVRTGTFCCYAPTEPTTWRIRQS